MSKILIVPIAGESKRYPNNRPKWLLTHPKGNLMLIESIMGCLPKKFNKIIIVGLKKHEAKYRCFNSIKEELKKINENIIIHLLDEPTKNQPETIMTALRGLNIKSDSIFIKDCDNYFKINKIPAFNGVCVGNILEYPNIQVNNKSYVCLGKSKEIVNIVEKHVISNYFCCGGYFFSSAKSFIDGYNDIKNEENIYISHIIYKRILEKENYFTFPVKNYLDWGTEEDWIKYTQNFKTIFVDIDGCLVKSSAEFFDPRWGTTEGLERNVKHLNALYNTGKVQIILTTSRKTSYRQITEDQLKKIGFKYDTLIMDLYHAKRYLINDYSKSFPTAIAINLKRDAENLENFLK